MVAVRIALVAVLWITIGCSASSSSGGSGPPVTPGAQPTRGQPAGSSAGPGSLDLPTSVVDPVIAEIARVAGVAPEEVVVISAETMTFSDGSLGCPEPGMMYTQALVDGYKIVAEAGGMTYDYRGSGTGDFRRCTTP